MSVKFMVIFVVAGFIGATVSVPAEFVAALLEYREHCINVSGSDEGYEQILASIQPAKTCVLNRLDMEQLQIDAAQLANGVRRTFFDKYCPKFNESMTCFEDTLEGIAKCVDEDTDQVKQILMGIAYSLLDLACQNGGQFFFDAQKPEYRICLAQLKKNGAGECKLSASIRKRPFARYGEAECRELDVGLKCIQKKIDECNAPRLFDIFRVIFDAISKANDCKQFTSLEEMSSNYIAVF